MKTGPHPGGTVLVLGLALTATAGDYLSQPADRGYFFIDGYDLIALVDEDRSTVLIDTRSEAQYARDHIPGAVNLPAPVRCPGLKAAAPAADTPLIFYCADTRCADAEAGAATAAACGYEAVYWLRGGIEAWQALYPPMP